MEILYDINVFILNGSYLGERFMVHKFILKSMNEIL